MNKSRILRASAAGVTSLGLVAGFAGMAGASAGTNDTTGAGSNNHVSSKTRNSAYVHNRNHVDLTNNNPQFATSGHVMSLRNTRADGTTASGDASNHSTLNGSVSIANSDAGMMGAGSGGSSNNTGQNNTTGADSNNSVSSKTTNKLTVRNDNDVHITNNNWQSAKSGSVDVMDNTRADGNVQSGDASNTSSSTFNVDIKN